MGEDKETIPGRNLGLMAGEGGSRLSRSRSEDLIGEYTEAEESGPWFETVRFVSGKICPEDHGEHGKSSLIMRYFASLES